MGCIWSTEYSVHPIYSSLLGTYLGIHPTHPILYSVQYILQYMVTLSGVVDQPTRAIMCYRVRIYDHIQSTVLHTPYCYIRVHKRKFNSITYIILLRTAIQNTFVLYLTPFENR